jgi:hypothetical protein
VVVIAVGVGEMLREGDDSDVWVCEISCEGTGRHGIDDDCPNAPYTGTAEGPDPDSACNQAALNVRSNALVFDNCDVVDSTCTEFYYLK